MVEPKKKGQLHKGHIAAKSLLTAIDYAYKN
jgi:hypothetical protein